MTRNTHRRSPAPTGMILGMLLLSAFGIGTTSAAMTALLGGEFTWWNIAGPLVGLASLLAAVEVAHGTMRPRRYDAYAAALAAFLLVCTTDFLPRLGQFAVSGLAGGAVGYAIFTVLSRRDRAGEGC